MSDQFTLPDKSYVCVMFPYPSGFDYVNIVIGFVGSIALGICADGQRKIDNGTLNQ